MRKVFCLPSIFSPRFNWLCGSFLIIFIVFNACKNQEPKVKSLTIAAAANMQYAINEISKQYTKQTGIPCNLIISSSGKLTAQIIEGAPIDIFLSADKKYPLDLYHKGLAKDPPLIYGFGKLALWSFGAVDLPSMQSLLNPDIRHIAIANPEIAPYGRAAQEVIEYHDLFDTLSAKLVYGESIAQVNQFISSGAAEIGFTSLSVVMAAKNRDTGKWVEVDSLTYEPIAQGLIIINDSKEASDFIDFIRSEIGKNILVNHGYELNE